MIQSSKIKITNLFYILFFVLLFGKFYFFSHGWVRHLLPLAPLYLILLRDIILCVFLMLLFFYYVLKNSLSFSNVSIVIVFVFLILILSSFINLYRVDYYSFTQHYLRNSILYLSFLVFGFSLVSKNDVNKFVKFLFFAVLLHALLAIFLEYINPGYKFDGRMLGLTDNPNTLAGIIFVGITISYMYFWTTTKFIYFVLLVVFFYTLYRTGSFTYIALTGLFIFVYSITNIRKIKVLPILTYGFCFLTILLTLVFIFKDTPTYYNVINSPVINRAYDVFASGNPLKVHTIAARLNSYNSLNSFFGVENANLILFGNFNFNKYIKYDSAFLVLLQNFGLLIFVTFVFAYVYVIVKALLNKNKIIAISSKMNFDILFYNLVFFFISGIVRNVFNRFPLNIIAYTQLGILLKLLIESNYYKNKKVN